MFLLFYSSLFECSSHLISSMKRYSIRNSKRSHSIGQVSYPLRPLFFSSLADPPLFELENISAALCFIRDRCGEETRDGLMTELGIGEDFEDLSF